MSRVTVADVGQAWAVGRHAIWVDVESFWDWQDARPWEYVRMTDVRAVMGWPAYAADDGLLVVFYCQWCRGQKGFREVLGMVNCVQCGGYQ